jgi:AcrR family transcriptional regulator
MYKTGSKMKIDIREKIINATIELLEEHNDAGPLTMRLIAEKAGVGLGLINYHFKTREALINDAIGEMMFHAVKPHLAIPSSIDGDPKAAIRAIFRATSDIGMRYSLGRFAVQFALLQGNMEVPALIVPLVRQYYGKRKDDLEIRLIAFSMVTTMQVAYIRSDAFRLYAGVDIQNEVQRNELIDQIIDQYLFSEEK